MVEKERQRLTSWKEIASHLGRDVRTVLRWEKDRGLPVHRVPGATGRVVFAYTDELDTWARGELPKAERTLPEASPSPGAPAPAAPDARRPWRVSLAAIAALAALGLVAWRMGGSRADESPLTLRVTETAIVASSPGGVERWRHPFRPGETTAPAVGHQHEGESVVGGDVLAATGYTTRGSDAVVRGGELFRFSPDGILKSTFTFEDRPRFLAGLYGPPWDITDYRVENRGGTHRVAVAAHHYEWWPSIVTVLDGTWKRRGTFVNAGWIERLHWVTPDRLVIAGFSNIHDGGMIALLDARTLDGQSPAPRGSQFECTSCGPGGPLRYIVMPRSEVNRVSASPFNRVVLIPKRDALVARTIEKPSEGPADAIYEFTLSLDLMRASYSDRYWDIHRELEALGKITHTRWQCPDRDGPKEIRVWEPATGWTTKPTAPLRSRAPASIEQ